MVELVLAMVLVGCVQTTTAGPATAADAPVRSSDIRLRALIQEGVSASPTFAGLEERIRAGRAIVYFEWSQSLPRRLEAALLNRVTVTPSGTRLLRVLVKRQPPQRLLIPVLAHELQHALEALSSETVDLEATFDRIGQRSGGVHETEKAIAIQNTVQEELKRSKCGNGASVDRMGTRP